MLPRLRRSYRDEYPVILIAGSNLLICLFSEENLEELAYVIQSGTDVNTIQSARSNTLLHHGVTSNNSVEFFQMLFAAGIRDQPNTAPEPITALELLLEQYVHYSYLQDIDPWFSDCIHNQFEVLKLFAEEYCRQRLTIPESISQAYLQAFENAQEARQQDCRTNMIYLCTALKNLATQNVNIAKTLDCNILTDIQEFSGIQKKSKSKLN